MEYKKSVWRVSKVVCHNCHKSWTIQQRKPDIYVCPECQGKYKKAEEKAFWGNFFGVPIVWFISILLFPLGYIMFFAWRKQYRSIARAAFVGATMQVAFLLLIEFITRMVGV